MTKNSLIQGRLIKTIGLPMLSLLAFAGNSVLCRLALNNDVIDAASFTSIRLLAGLIFLFALVGLQSKQTTGKKNLPQGHSSKGKGSWLSAFFLFIYAIAFSYAYISLDAGMGALILFAAVQVTMIVFDLFKRKRLSPIEWAGLGIAFLGLMILLAPGANAPSIKGLLLMSTSGIAWGLYTLAGKGAVTPLKDTANNFLRTLPFILILLIITANSAQLSNQGILLAILAGTLTSGLGYTIWYAALEYLSITQAAIIQLNVPVIAAFGGILFLEEVISLPLICASMLILGGVLIVFIGTKNTNSDI